MVSLNKSFIEIYFDFDWSLVDRVSNLPDREFVKSRKMWRVPASPFHAGVVINALKNKFHIMDEVHTLAASAPAQKSSDPILTGKDYAALFPFQREGLEFILKRGGRVILADDMGLGKTVTALYYVRAVEGATLVVCPANVTYKWVREVERWLPGKKATPITSGKDVLDDADVHVISYDLMKNRIEELLEKNYTTIIFDECHAVKNYKAQRTKAAKRLSSRSDHLLFLSGTPFMNHPTELFTLLNMLDPVTYPNFFQFARRYCGASMMNGYWYFPNTLTNGDELRERLKTVMVRHTKREVLKELPDKTRTLVPILISNQSEYNKARREFKTWYAKEGRDVSKANQLTKLSALRHVIGLGKVPHALSLAEDILHGDEQVVLFAHHKDVAAALVAGLPDYQVGVISGDVSAKDRGKLTAAFAQHALQVMVITVAGAEGIDLFTSSNIIFVEREWTPAKEEQAEDRLHRMGQKNAVTCWYLVAKGTVDERLAEVVHRKRDLFGQVVSQDEIVQTILEGV